MSCHSVHVNRRSSCHFPQRAPAYERASHLPAVISPSKPLQISTPPSPAPPRPRGRGTDPGAAASTSSRSKFRVMCEVSIGPGRAPVVRRPRSVVGFAARLQHWATAAEVGEMKLL